MTNDMNHPCCILIDVVRKTVLPKLGDVIIRFYFILTERKQFREAT